MRKFYSLVLSGLAATLTMTAVADRQKMADEFHLDGKKPLVSHPVKNVKMPEKMPAFGDPNELITKAPAGTTKNYVRDGYFWYPYWGYMMFDYKSNNCAEMVEGDDGFTYIKNPYTDFVSDSYLKGKREGDKITVNLPQPIYREPSMTEPGKYNTYYAVIMVEEYSGSDYYIVTDRTELNYVIDGDKITLDLGYIPQQDPWGGWKYPYYILGLVTDEGMWMSEGEALQTWEPFSGTPVEVPASVDFEDWAMTTASAGQFAKIGFDGNDIYMKGLLPALPDGVFKGTIDGDKVTFKSGQYLGIYNSDTYTYMVGINYDAEGNSSLAEEITLSYDAANKVIKCPEDCAIAYNRRDDSLSVIKLWRAPEFRLQPSDIDQTPLAPTFIEYEAFTEEKNQGFFRFDLPIYNAEGYVLNDQNMYYNVYFDGALETFYTDEYTRLEEDMTDVPYTFGDGWNFYALGTVHVLYYYSRGVKEVGIVLRNKVDGTVYSSPITTLNLETGDVTTGVDGIMEPGLAVSEEWYTLDGKKVAHPAAGIYVHKMVMGDGSLKVAKTVVK